MYTLTTLLGLELKVHGPDSIRPVVWTQDLDPEDLDLELVELTISLRIDNATNLKMFTLHNHRYCSQMGNLTSHKSKSKSNLVICIAPYYGKHHC